MRILQNRDKLVLNDRQIGDIRSVREMAAALVLAHTGTEFDDGVIDGVCDNVACVAEELDLSPDDVQRVLEILEPTLAAE